MRLGIAHVSPGYNQGATVLQDGVDAIAALGCDTIKLWCSGNFQGDENPARPDYPGQSWGSTPTSLTELAQTAPMAYALGKAGITRYYLGTWDFYTGIYDPWKGDITKAQIEAMYAEMYAFCVHLLTTFSGKDFVIQTAESDWAIINNGTQTAFAPGNVIDQRIIDRCVAFYGARIKAIRDARESVVSSSRVLSCIEVNRVLDGGRRIHRDVLPRLDPDEISWTSYEGEDDWVLDGATQESVEAAIAEKTTAVITRIRAELVKAKGPRAANIPITIGEIGWPERHPLFAQPGGFDVGAFVNVMHTTALALGCKCMTFWSYNDNEVYTDPAPTHPQGRYLYDENGDISAQGTAFLALL